MSRKRHGWLVALQICLRTILSKSFLPPSCSPSNWPHPPPSTLQVTRDRSFLLVSVVKEVFSLHIRSALVQHNVVRRRQGESSICYLGPHASLTGWWLQTAGSFYSNDQPGGSSVMLGEVGANVWHNVNSSLSRLRVISINCDFSSLCSHDHSESENTSSDQDRPSLPSVALLYYN